MACIKKIQNTEVYGSKFSSRTLTTAGDISGYTFKAVVKNIIQGKILEIPGVKNAGTINFDFSQLETLKKSTYKIEYWGDFGALGNEPFLLEEFSIVSAENATNCANSDNLNFEIKIEEISIPVTITKAINNFSLNIENLTPEQIAQLKGEKGEKGDKGDKGDTGLQGIQGIQGIQGEKGEKGDTGEKGDKGDKGDTGATGLQGLQGIQGVKGDKGEKGDKGDAFSYADFTPTQISELQKPANDKVIELEDLEASLTNSESLRVQNENNRISSENSRNTNEQTRVNAENNRVSAETSRVSAENARVNSENTRISNENARATAENTRVSSENNRISAENSRVTAESSRVTAENARAAAEIERQKNKAFNVKVTTPSSYVTGTLAETQVLRIEIPANSISDNSFLNMPILYLSKIGTNGNMSIKGKLSTSPTMPSGTTDVIFGFTNIGNTIQSFGMDRIYIISEGLIKSFPFLQSPYSSSAGNANSFSSKPFDRTVTNYLYVSIQLGNTADQARLEGLQLTNS